MKPTLLVMAAGMGSRYGGLKQLDPVGPHGEIIIDFSVYDAMRAGFGQVVFVIRRDIETTFREVVGTRFERRIAVDYAFQELDLLPPGFKVPGGRTKPWGTAQAILAAEDKIREPFAAINADDFYGARSFQALGDFLRSTVGGGVPTYAMVGFTLRHTLSEHGSVARGVCECDANGRLKSVTELTKVEKRGGRVTYTDAAGQVHVLSGDEPVSMNMWGFAPPLFPQLRELFVEFLQAHGHEAKSEFYIPQAVNTLVARGAARVKVLPTDDAWFGVTYKEDKPTVVNALRQLINRGDYPSPLWG